MTDHPNLATALSAFQANLPRLRKTTSGQVPGKRDYKYADLADVNQDVLTELAKHGLCWMCGPTRADDGTPVLRWELLHASGESRTGDYELPRDVTSQQMGSAITYGRRYCVTAVTGVVPDEDDDGAAASQVRGQPPAQRTAPPVQAKADLAKAELRKACSEHGWDMRKVADRFVAEHGAELGETSDAALINRFRESLSGVPQAELAAA